MFTGLIEDVGRIRALHRRSDAVVLSVAPAHLPCGELAIGDSVAIDGVCLTVTEIHRDQFSVLAGAETLARTTVGRRKIGDVVNLERAVAVGSRLGGHYVQGHVDGVGEIMSMRDEGANLVIAVRPPRELLRFIIEKGSITIDGISLTVNHVDASEFRVAIIPHTRDQTTLSDRRAGGHVNVEVDLIGKYVERLARPYFEERAQ